MQKDTLNIAEAQWKQSILLFRYRREMGLTRNESAIIKKRIKVLANHVQNVYQDIEGTKSTNFGE
jgi:hypothetical protein